MKNKFALALALALGLTVLSGGTALAESTVAVESPVSEESSYWSWIGEGIDWLKEVYTTGRDTVVNGTEWLAQEMKSWNESVQAYIDEMSTDSEVQEAWNTLKEGAENAGKVTVEAATEAYHTVRDWMTGQGETVDQEVASALDGMAAAAGVEEAEVSEWYRTVESYIARNAETVTESTKAAWELIKETNLEGANIAKEQVKEAYQTVADWLDNVGTEEAETAEEALENIRES